MIVINNLLISLDSALLFEPGDVCGQFIINP